MSARSLLLLVPSAFKGENHGSYVQHVASMRELLTAESGWTVEVIDLFHPELALKALASDVVVVHMLPARQVEAVIRLRRARGLPTVFEISDNFLDIGDWLTSRTPLRSPLYRQQLLYHASLCDAVQVYSPGLARLFESVNPRFCIFDPWVPTVACAKPVNRDPAFVVGWGGTTTHSDDLAGIVPAVLELCRRHPHAVFAYIGAPALFNKYFSAIPASQIRVRPFGGHDAYLDFVSEWDVGLVPLGASAFNAARTDTKFATYAARGIAAVLQRHPVHTPHEARAALFDTPQDLARILERLYCDRAGVAELGGRAHEWVQRERGAARLRGQRAAFYESLMRNARRPGVAPGAGEAAALLLETMEGSPLAQLRRHATARNDREAYLRTLLVHQPYDYFALTAAIDACKREDGDPSELARLYARLCMVAPEAVPPDQRPQRLADLLPT